MNAFSVRQPLAWCAVNGVSGMINNTVAINHRGLLAIYADSIDKERERALRTRSPRIAFPNVFETGGIVGWVRVVDCVTESDSEWFTGPFGYVLQDEHTHLLRPYRKAAGFFDVIYSEHGHAPCGCPLRKSGADIATVRHVPECLQLNPLQPPPTRRKR